MTIDEKLYQVKQSAPYHIDDLLTVANDILAFKGLQQVIKRTLRFYIQNGLVPRPIGSPKFARYEYRHLLSLVGARTCQDHGMKLNQIKENLEARWKDESELLRFVREQLEMRSVTVQRNSGVREAVHVVDTRALKLTENSVLHINKSANLGEELTAIREAISEMIADKK
ncbi:MAG: MerR family transcriptional regulator [Armatimonadetes bacterium]|nr:MerR family transcriptional regulator [Armatimonadota bacterium]